MIWNMLCIKTPLNFSGLKYKMTFQFTNEYPVSRLDEIVSYLMGPRLWIPHGDYPDFLDWADRVHRELKHDNKRALVAFSSGGGSAFGGQNNEIVGVAVYQRHKAHDDTLEIKNLTVRPDKRGRYIASFLLRNAEIEGAKDFKSKRIICDAKAKNFEIKSFLLKNHYRILAKDDLYRKNGGEDLIYSKTINYV